MPSPGIRTRTRPRYVSIVTEVEVDVDPDDLAEAGYHHEDDCPNKPTTARGLEAASTRDAIASLHRQAHPSAARDPFLCREEPCRSLPSDLLAPPIGTEAKSA